MQEQIVNNFEAAWHVLAQTCGHSWAPGPSYQAWFAHDLITQFGIDRVASEPIIQIIDLSDSALKSKGGGGEVRPDIVATRAPGITTPPYANRLGNASDLSELGPLKSLAVVSEFKTGASAQRRLQMKSLVRDVDKLQLLLDEFQLNYPKAKPPLAYSCVLDNHGQQEFDADTSRRYRRTEAPGVKPLIISADARPLVCANRLITR